MSLKTTRPKALQAQQNEDAVTVPGSHYLPSIRSVSRPPTDKAGEAEVRVARWPCRVAGPDPSYNTRRDAKTGTSGDGHTCNIAAVPGRSAS
jgi:hypothetical protein